MDALELGDVVLVRGIVTPEGVRIGDIVVPPDQADVVSEVPDMGPDPVILLMFFYDEVERANFAAAFKGLPEVECRNV